MSENPLSSVLSNKINVAGREIPVIVLGGGIGLLAGVAALIARRNSAQSVPGGSGSNGAGSGGSGGSVADQFSSFSASITQQVNESLASQSASVAWQFAGFQSNIQGQLQSQQAATGQQLTQLSDQIGLLQGSTGRSIAGLTQNVNTIRQDYTTLNNRVTVLEQGQAKSAKVDRNLIRFLSQNILNLMAIGGYTPAQQQQQSQSLLQYVVTPAGAQSAQYEGF